MPSRDEPADVPAQGKRTRWASPTVSRRSVDADGVLWVTADVLDADGVKVGTLVATMTPSRELRVEWQHADGAEPLRGFSAWRKGGE